MSAPPAPSFSSIRARLAIALLTMLGLVWLVWSHRPRTIPVPIEPDGAAGPVGDVHAATDGIEPEEPAVEATADDEPDDPILVEPVPPPPLPAPPMDACASGEDDPAVDRPSIFDLVQVRAAELDDRVRLALRREGTSETLRRGLVDALDPAHEREALALIAAAPDRHQDGFDHYAAVVSVLAWQALREDDTRRARELSRSAEHGAPSDALSFLVDALACEAMGDEAGALAALAEAFRLEPAEPAIALAYFRRLRDGADVETAVRAAEAYVAEVPADHAVHRQLLRLRMRRAAVASGTERRLRDVAARAPAAVDVSIVDRALDVTDRALTDASRLIGVPRRGSLALFVYRTHAELVAATCAPAWAAALYDGALHVDADRLGVEEESLTSLRHEVLHAALHAAVPGTRPTGEAIVPTWLDEGLAQYFAGEEPYARRSFELMVRERTFVPLASMNGHFLVIEDPRDAGLAYHQALAMVLHLVDRRGERGIAEAVTYLAGGGDPDALLAGIGAPLEGRALLAFLERRRAARSER